MVLTEAVIKNEAYDNSKYKAETGIEIVIPNHIALQPPEWMHYMKAAMREKEWK